MPASSPIGAARWCRISASRETEEEGRYRQAACLLADISWRAHPDYRGLQALNIIAHSTFSGITHAGRAFIALANYYRFEGLADDGATEPLAAIATPRLLELAKLLGGLLRVVYLFSASMPGIVRNLDSAAPTPRTSISNSSCPPPIRNSPANASTAGCSSLPG